MRSVSDIVLNNAADLIKIKGEFTEKELHIECLPGMIELMAQEIQSGHSRDSVSECLGVDNIVQPLIMSEQYVIEGNNWKKDVENETATVK